MDSRDRIRRESEVGGCSASPNLEYKFMVKVGLEGLGSEATTRCYTFQVETQSFQMNPRTSFLQRPNSHLDIHIPRGQHGSASLRERRVRHSIVNPNHRVSIFDRTIVPSPSRRSVAPVRGHSRIIREVRVRRFGRELGISPENFEELEQREEAAAKEEEEEEEEEEERGKCAICLEAISGCGRWLPCSHQYHQDCIANWLQTRNVCPLCRSQAS